MFTGIIETTAKVEKQGKGILTVVWPKACTDIKDGSSIAVSGACLTVIDLHEKFITFDVIPETLKKTTLGNLRKGDMVNLERALPAHGRFAGHIVQGHVEGVGVVVKASAAAAWMVRLRSPQAAAPNPPNPTPNPNPNLCLAIRLPASLSRAIVPKGSIAIDGVSLTVAEVSKDTCTVALIPTTLKETTLGRLKKGDRVNIETDILVRMVERLLPRK
ncbi:MAG: riboflavin synthase [Candidatus Peregrinibacteria bacterium]